jgi:DNA-binding NarL/FixJ family response regulator
VIRVLIADDQALMRQGFRMILSAEPDIDVIGEADTGSAATRELPDVKVLILTTFGNDEHVAAALAAGASGFLLKDTTPEQLIHAVRVIAAGDALIDPAVTRRLIQHALPSLVTPTATSEAFDRLSAREMEVLRLLAHGMSNAEIAGALVVSEATVKTHVSRLLAKLGLRDRVQAVVLAYQTHLV